MEERTYSIAERELMFRNLAGNPAAKKVAGRALAIEDEETAKEASEERAYPWPGFEWTDIPAQTQLLNQLVIDELLVTGGPRGTYRSRSTSTYKLKEPELVRECLEKIKGKADSIVVSQTPLDALLREWEEHGIHVHVRAIAGQEMGTKSEHITFAAKGKYAPEKMLMIGDALGDLKAARANDALFFPVIPGHEEASWERLFAESLDRFFNGNYRGEYEKELLSQFEKYLPEDPPWKN